MQRCRRKLLLVALVAIALTVQFGRHNITTNALQQPPRPIITPENANRVTELAVLGRGTIHDLAWSPDGNTIALAGSRGVWLLDYTDLPAEPRLLEGHTGVVLAVDFHPDGEILASASRDGTLRLWNVESGEEIAQLSPTSGLDVAFSPDGTHIAAPSVAGYLESVTLRVWNFESLEETATFEYREGGITSLEFTADSQSIIVGSDSMSDMIFGRIAEFNLSTGEIVYESGVSPVVEISLGAETGGVAVASIAWSEPYQIFDGFSQSPFEFTANTVDFSPDGQWLAIGGHDFLRLWNTSNNELVFSTDESTDIARFSPNGNILATFVDGEIHFWNVHNWTKFGVVDYFTNSINRISFSPDGELLAGMDTEHVVTIWSVDTVNRYAKFSVTPSPISMAFNGDGTRLLFGHVDGSVSIWDVSTLVHLETIPVIQQPVRSIDFISIPNENDSTEVAIVGEGTLQVSNGNYPGVKVSTIDGMTLLQSEEDSTLNDEVTVIDVTVVENSSRLVVGFNYSLSTRRIIVVDRISGEWIIADSMTIDNSGSHMAASPNGEWLALGTGFGDGPYGVPAQLWLIALDDLAARNELIVGSLDSPLDVLYEMDFNPNSDLLATGEGDEFWLTYFWPITGHVRIWNVATRQLLITFDGHTRPVYDVTFSPDGTLIASASRDGTVRLWGIPTD